MFRPLLVSSLAVAAAGLTGCHGTWDTLTSRRFREHPMTTMQRMVSPEDPVAVLLADPPRDGDERAAALHRLKEPIRNRGTQEEQDAILDLLAKTAATDPSPVLRMEAIGALGRFEDVRTVPALATAYQNAHGRRPTDPAPRPPADPGVVAAGLSAGRAPTRPQPGGERFPITGPTGFAPELVSAIRCRAVEALGRTNRPEAVRYLTAVAGGAGADVEMDGSEDRQVRLAAVRGLGACRQPEAVAALAQVLKAEAGKPDTALVGRTHEGLMRLTGKRLPPDPEKWNEVVQAGVVVAPEPGWLENAIFWSR